MTNRIHLLFAIMVFSTLSSADAQIKPAEPNSSEAVLKQLDLGGNFLFYTSTEKFFESVEKEIHNYSDVIGELFEFPPEKLKPARKDLIDLLHQSGWNQISGIGASQFAMAPDVYRSRIFIHHHPVEDPGLLWRGIDRTPCTYWKAFPKDTVSLHNSRVAPKATLKWLSNIMQSSLTEWLPGDGTDTALKKVSEYVSSYGNEIALGIIMSEDSLKKADPEAIHDDTFTPDFLIAIELLNQNPLRELLALVKKQDHRITVLEPGANPLIKVDPGTGPFSYCISIQPDCLVIGSTLEIVRTFAANRKAPTNDSVTRRADWRAAFPDDQPAQQKTYHSKLVGHHWKRVMQFLQDDQPDLQTFIEQQFGLEKEPMHFSANTFWREDGWLIESYSNRNGIWGCVTHFVSAPTGVFIALVAGLQTGEPEQQPLIQHPRGVPAPLKPRPNPFAKQPVPDETTLEKFGQAVKDYRNRADTMPAGRGEKGLAPIARMQNLAAYTVNWADHPTNYYYLGSGMGTRIPNRANIPVIIERPGIVPGTVGVVFLDGSTLRVEGRFKDGGVLMEKLQEMGRVDEKRFGLLKFKASSFRF